MHAMQKRPRISSPSGLFCAILSYIGWHRERMVAADRDRFSLNRPIILWVSKKDYVYDNHYTTIL